MANILDYLKWRGDLTLRQAPFNEIDALILARLSYAPLRLIAPYAQTEEITVREACERLLARPDIQSIVLRPEDTELFRALKDNERFRDMGLLNHVDRLDPESQTQFSAMTVRLEGDRLYAAFRGTDNTLVGWKEDFNMSFQCPVPAQASAVEYLRRTIMENPGNFIVGGHSKGGNLALYASAFCGADAQPRILSVYNFDGPGFNEETLKTPEYRAIRDRAKTFIPQSSIVGMLLGHEEKYIIVRSLEKNGFWQHDVYTWTLERDRLIRLDEVTDSSRFFDRTLKGWVADMEPAQREKFFDALYDVCKQTNAKTVREMEGNWFHSAKTILFSLKNLDDSTKKVINRSLDVLMKNAKSNLKIRKE